jgi:murein DD-endopeptidase MepM/ murein hydrolase activator NlpD
MKKMTGLVSLLLISISVFLLGFDYRKVQEPNTYYQVYLDEKVIGTIKSKEELEKYIDRRGEFIKDTYEIDEVYAPQGLEIRRITTFSDELDDVEKVYKLIEKERPFTISGYQFTLRSEDDTKKINVLDKKVFDDAIISTYKTFVGENRYKSYADKSQPTITTTGKVIESVYIEEKIAIKNTNIPVNEKIYTDSKELAKFLLFGTVENQKEYTVIPGDTIETVSFNNKISVEEFLISNPTFTSSKNLLYPSQKITIGVTNPQVRVVIKEHVVEDLENKYKTEFVVDESLYVGDRKVVQKGTNGVIRVSQNIVTMNGVILDVSDREGKKEILAPINEIVRVGKRQLPINVGTDEWLWPTMPGWRITSYYGYRIHPITRERHLHNGIDIAGTGFGSNIFAADNGTIIMAQYYYNYGKNIIIDHNNGYYSLYAHLDGYTVSVGDVVVKGQVIGKMGNTGRSTGTHLHFSIFLGNPTRGGQSINPLRFY